MVKHKLTLKTSFQLGIPKISTCTCLKLSRINQQFRYSFTTAVNPRKQITFTPIPCQKWKWTEREWKSFSIEQLLLIKRVAVNHVKRKTCIGKKWNTWRRPLACWPKRRLYCSTLRKISGTSGSRCNLDAESLGTNKVIGRRHNGHLHAWRADPWSQTCRIQLARKEEANVEFQYICSIFVMESCNLHC